MPTLSASDYTKYIKFQAAAQANTNGPPRMIQTTDQVAPNNSIINAYLKTSQASFIVNPTITNIAGLNYVRARPVVQQRNNPDALSTVSYAGTSGALSSSRFQRVGGLPTGFKNSQGTYYRVPTNPGWVQGGAANQ